MNCSKKLGRYYSRAGVGELLVDEMSICNPAELIDLGAGGAALLGAAASKWKSASLFSVDIDPKVSRPISERFKHRIHSHFTANALSFDLADKIGHGWGRFDAAICNPPFTKQPWSDYYGDILDAAGICLDGLSKDDVTSDILFFAQNLRLLKDDGALGLIVPDGVVAGLKFLGFRKQLFRSNSIMKIIELPRQSFKGTEAKAHIIVMKKGLLSNQLVYVQRLGPDGHLSNPIEIDPTSLPDRLDYTYLLSKYRASKRECKPLSDMVHSISRGGLSSSQIKALDVKVLHTTDMLSGRVAEGLLPQDKFSLCKYRFRDEHLANKGDILIARVGRNLSEKIIVCPFDRMPVSDSIFIVRPKPQHRKLLYRFFGSKKGKDELEAATQGVGAKYISLSVLKNILVD